ncbi:hypothetical protein [uncultured Cohaesibacter sp.]|uniref:hypothetical protein n=1 Tax=uncultured Cohaesibacter sp. TaxID=1002546 RepID=UPI0029C82788|nr:hypothetical protein [uncultured Cohaesibacter sp.]
MDKFVVWNDLRMLTAAGKKVEPIRRLLSENKQPIPSENAVALWLSRGKIPDAWRARIAFSLLRTGRITVAELFTKGTAE